MDNFSNKIVVTLLITFIYMFILIYLCLLQPSTAIANQLPGQLVSTQIRTTGI